MFLIVGLGNPGEKYVTTRHNVGFMTVECMLHRYSFSSVKDKFSGKLATGEVNGEKIALLMPQTFMNVSGDSVQKAASFYKIPPENIIVIHDELDVPVGKVKIKQGGGDAGHNGLKSITQRLGTNNYWRVRVGISHPGDKDRVSGYVLSDFSKDERPVIDDICDAIAKNLSYILDKDAAKALDFS